MTSLRRHTRDALAAGDLTTAEAHADFARLAARVRRPRAAWIALGAVGAAAAAAGAYLIVARGPIAAPAATEIYIHVAGEPAGDALALSIVTHPDGRSALVVTPEGARP